MYGCRFLPDMPDNGLPPLVNDPELVQLVKDAALRSSCVEETMEPVPLTLGEDFAIYLQQLPGAFWILGVAPKGRADGTFA